REGDEGARGVAARAGAERAHGQGPAREGAHLVGAVGGAGEARGRRGRRSRRRSAKCATPLIKSQCCDKESQPPTWVSRGHFFPAPEKKFLATRERDTK